MSLDTVRFALMFVLSMPFAGAAQQSDSELPLNIEADRAELNETTGVGVYRGDVRITQGNMVLTADTVTVIAPARRLQKIIAEGDKSTFRQTAFGEDAPGENELWAEALRMVYEPGQNSITLLGDAFLRRARNNFAAERIVYDIRRRIVDADDPEGAGRVEMTLVPVQDKDVGDDASATPAARNR